MSVITNLTDNINKIQKMIDILNEPIIKYPNDFSLKLNYDSLNNQMKELQEQLYKENIKQMRESYIEDDEKREYFKGMNYERRQMENFFEMHQNTY